MPGGSLSPGRAGRFGGVDGSVDDPCHARAFRLPLRPRQWSRGHVGHRAKPGERRRSLRCARAGGPTGQDTMSLPAKSWMWRLTVLPVRSSFSTRIEHCSIFEGCPMLLP